MASVGAGSPLRGDPPKDLRSNPMYVFHPITLTGIVNRGIPVVAQRWMA
jgi:hypothetical protein